MKNIIFLALGLSLTSCGPKIIETTYTPLQTQILQPERPAEIIFKNFQWIVLTDKNKNDILRNNQVFIGLNQDDFKDLTDNMSEILRYSKQQDAIISYYERVTDVSGKNSK